MHPLLTHCAISLSEHGNLFVVFFLGGLTGSLTHCLSMCAPVLACQSACGASCGTRMDAALQWPYHAARLLTYSSMGFVAAWFSMQIAALSYWPTLSAVMMVLAALLFLLSAMMPARHTLMRFVSTSRFLRGVLMSFMPCGLLYAALMMAATLANPLSGMIAMALFVLGTIPALVLVSSGTTLLAQKWKAWVNNIGRLGMACNGLTLLALAISNVR